MRLNVRLYCYSVNSAKYQSAYINFAQIWYSGIVLSDTKIAKNMTI